MKPYYIDWAVTARCDLRCEHCTSKSQVELPLECSCELAEEIVGLDPEWVIVEGGEPLMREGLLEILKKMESLDVYFITNGMGLSEGWVEALGSIGAKIIFPMDGFTKSVYEGVKRGASFERLIRSVELASSGGLFHGITVVLSRKNLHQIGELIEFVAGHGGKFVTLIPLQPFGGGALQKNYYETYALTGREHARALQGAYEKARQHQISVYYDEPFLWAFAEQDGMEIPHGRSGITIPELKGCGCGACLYIEPDGKILPCMFSPRTLAISEYPEQSLERAWEMVQDSEFIKMFKSREHRRGACASCEHFEICYGCLARICKLCGNPLESDSACPLAASGSSGDGENGASIP